jgi:hypothetical protein
VVNGAGFLSLFLFSPLEAVFVFDCCGRTCIPSD